MPITKSKSAPAREAVHDALTINDLLIQAYQTGLEGKRKRPPSQRLAGYPLALWHHAWNDGAWMRRWLQKVTKERGIMPRLIVTWTEVSDGA